ncbi:MAG: hypothetical protein SCABRO_01062 [Candidatus Scalindua brodae]|uniref:Resolvase/invertase-type recombinase catalytic domain-containing protein n=1 Tax=Candidatus Scalindua brodae TaxID=237368 RepID=A0A0B0EPS2_9BACT|nr:MAG: hypothetical protein SCABRO_01062 [Candidatus Scalindua brodae]
MNRSKSIVYLRVAVTTSTSDKRLRQELGIQDKNMLSYM